MSAFGNRDFRVDACRGFALIMILMDHIAGNIMGHFTMWNYGFCDAAELFVFLSGYSVWLAYGRLIDKPAPYGGWENGLRKIGRRWITIYLYQFVMVLSCVLLIRIWVRTFGSPANFIEPILLNSWTWVRSFAVLHALPQKFNILQIYCVFLAVTPLIIVLYRINSLLLLTVSFAFWLTASLYPAFNLHNSLSPSGWYFNPLGWQFIFVIGMVLAAAGQKKQGSLPHSKTLSLFCFVFLAFALIQSFPFERWGVHSYRLFATLPLNEKTPLGLWRAINAICIMYLVLSSDKMTRWSRMRLGRVLALLGRNSLEVFCFGTVAAILAGLLISSFGETLRYQVAANAFVFLVAFTVAIVHDKRKLRAKDLTVGSLGQGREVMRI